MFTGLIEDVGRLDAIRLDRSGSQQGSAVLSIRTNIDTSDWELGESVAVQGACLTVTSVSGDVFTADCSPETLKRTGLGALQKGSVVHLERALRLGARLGGHLVSGHVDGVGEIVGIEKDNNAYTMSIRPPKKWMRYMIEKGSVALDGVSLTINTLEQTQFSVAIIPHTWKHTRFHTCKVGDKINIEVDMIGKYIERLMDPSLKEDKAKDSGISEDFLKKHGFF